MTKKIYLMLLSVFLSVTYLSAQVVQTVNVPTAGGFATAIGSNLKTVTDLTLTGAINAADFNTIKQMTALKNLDMSKVAVVDNTLPNNAFDNRVLNSLTLPEGLVIIGGSAFENSKIRSITLPSTVATLGNRCFWNSSTVVDFSKAKSSLTSIGWGAFWGYTGSSTIDFSDFSLLKSFDVYAGSGPFSNYTGHVLIPSNLVSVPNYVFGYFKGSVSLSDNITSIGDGSFYGAEMASLELPSKVKSIGGSAFENSKIRSITLPSTVAILGNRCFWNSSTVVDFSKAKSSLTSIGWGVFWEYTGSATLDFSDFSLLKSFGVYAGSGPFSNYTGHVQIPSNLVSVPNYVFGNFKGSTFLSNNITSIGEGSFYEAKITSIDIPSGVTSIGTGAFHNATKLDTIISRNTTPPTLGTNVFYGVNKETTVLRVPDSSINLYGTAAQWKDFLNVNSTIPQNLELTYQIQKGYIPPNESSPGVWIPGEIEASYKAIRIGEYYWMTQNFNHEEPYRRQWKGIESGIEVDYPISQEMINKYLDVVEIDSFQYQVDIDKYTKDYGVYYSKYSRDYMSLYGRIYENNSEVNNKGWKLPSVKDFRQLIGMSSFRHYVQSDVLESRDVLYTFGAPYEANDMIKYILTTNCLDHTGTSYTTTDWYGMKYGLEDKYGFNLMLGGARINEVEPGKNEHWYTAKCDGSSLDVPWAQTGDLYHLFYATQLAASDGYLSLHDHVDTYPKVMNHWQHIRWCRLLTDEELGYKLYININNIDKSSSEWLSLKSGNEIPLLIKYRYSDLDRSQVSILKLGLKDSIPSGYIELPQGYIRGFYVNYLLDNPSPNVDISKVITYACLVDDGVLKIETRTTRSLESDDVVVPFKTDATVTLYPNPVQDVLNISGDAVEKVTIYDMSGRQVSTANNVNTISVSDLSKGTYLVRVLTLNGESTHKVIKK